MLVGCGATGDAGKWMRLFAWMRNFRRLVPPHLPAHPTQERLRSQLLRNANQPIELLNLWRLGISYAPPARASHEKEIRPLAD